MDSSPNQFNVLQLNCQRSYAVMCDLGECMLSECIDIALLQEPYIGVNGVNGLPSGMKVFTSASGKAAIAVVNVKFECMLMDDCLGENGVCVWIKCEWGEWYFASLYCRWGEEMHVYVLRLEELFSSLSGKNVVLGMDANATSELWHSKSMERGRANRERGHLLAEWIATNVWGVYVLNEPSESYTFSAAMGESDIDVTLANVNGMNVDFRWEVMDDWGMSDHNAIRIGVFETRENVAHTNICENKWRMAADTDWVRYVSLLRDAASLYGFECFASLECEDKVRLVTAWITNVNDECMKRISKRNRKGVAWWTEELSERKANVRVLRRRFQKAKKRNASDWENKWRTYRDAVNDYKKCMKEAKEGDWHEFGRKNANDPWGAVYRVCMGRRSAQSLAGMRTTTGYARNWYESANVLMENFFPRENERVSVEANVSVFDSLTEYAWDEVSLAIGKLRQRRAPGLDGINSVMIRLAWAAIPLYMKDMYDACLRESVFPRPWKKAKVIALLKGLDKDRRSPASYRPISLLNGLGKVLERLMTERLMNSMNGKWNECQFGFTEKKSTEDAWGRLKERVNDSRSKYVVGVFVDYKGAFDYLKWSVILECLRAAGCDECDLRLWRSYFHDRKACMRSSMDEVCVEVERGCPQGSIAGPFVWNLCMNALLDEYCMRNECVIAFADDLVVVVEANTRKAIEEKVSSSMRVAYEWGMYAGVSVSEEKTVCMLLKGKYEVSGRGVKINLNGNDVRKIKYVRSVKYLGISVGERMNFGVHIASLRSKVTNAVGCLRRVLRKEWGVNAKVARTWMNGLFFASVSYGASVWYEWLEKKSVSAELNRCMRVVMYASARVCRTVSTDAMQVLLGWLPWDLACFRRATLFKVRRGMPLGQHDVVGNDDIAGLEPNAVCRMIDARVNEMWQRRWDESRNGRVTYAFMSNVLTARRIRKFEPSLNVGYILTGHGTLNKFLHERSLSDSPLCVCGHANEDWKHVLCECEMYECFRDCDGMRVRIGADGMIDVSMVLSSSESYEKLCAFIERAYKMRASVVRRVNAVV